MMMSTSEATSRKSPDIQHCWFERFLGKMEFDRAWRTKKNVGTVLHARESSGGESPFLGRRDHKDHAGTSSAPPNDLQDLWLSEGQEATVVGRSPLLEEKSLLTFMK